MMVTKVMCQREALCEKASTHLGGSFADFAVKMTERSMIATLSSGASRRRSSAVAAPENAPPITATSYFSCIPPSP